MGKSSTSRHSTTLILSDVKASKIQDSTRFCVEVLTKKKAIVTAQAIVAVNTNQAKINHQRLKKKLRKESATRVTVRLTEVNAVADVVYCQGQENSARQTGGA